MNLRTARPRTALVGGVLALGLLAAGCGGGGGNGGGSADPCTSLGDAQTALAAAKKSFDDAQSVDFTMSTSSQPKSGSAVLGADGTLTHQPAFTGNVAVYLLGGRKDIKVVAVDRKVYANLFGAFSTIDPGEYGAPNPADFADPATGISGLLLKIADINGCTGKRDGKDKVAEYSGTLSGKLIAPIIPSASDTATYQTKVGVRSDGTLATLSVAGDFFAADGPVTYDLTFTNGQSVTVSAP